MFRGTKSPSPASSNYDFSLRHERVKLFARVLKQFDANISRTVQAMREVAGSLSTVGESYHEVAQCVNNTNPRSAMNRPYHVSNINSNRIVENYGANLQSAATVFAKEMTSLREGEQYVSFNSGVHQTVLLRLHEVITRAKKACALGDEVASALRKSVASRKIVQKKEAKYTRLGKPLTDSKLYTKQAEEMRTREQNYETKLRAFDTEYEVLMQRQLYVAGHTMDDFLDANTVYLAQMLKVLSCLAPHGADAVEGMVAASEALGNRLGIAPEEQVASRLRCQRVGDTPGEASQLVTPMKDSPGKASHGSSHNFTSYYRNRKHRGASADQAPPTARANDDCESGVAPTPCWSTSGSPQPAPVSSHSPQRRYEGLSEPDPTPPPPPPCPNPMARFRTAPTRSTSTVAAGPPARVTNAAAAAAAAVPVVPRSGGLVIKKTTTKGVPAAAAAKPENTSTAGAAAAAAASRAALQPPPPPARATAATAQTAAMERSVTLSPRRVPFGEGTTPAFHQQPNDGQRAASPPPNIPPTALSDARSPSGVAPTSQLQQQQQQQQQQYRAAVLQSQAGLLGLDRARSTEPFDDDCSRGVVSYTARSSLQPVNLLAAMDAAADRPSELQRKRQPPPQPQPQRHANPLALHGTTPAFQQLHQPRKTTKKARATLPTFAPLTDPTAAGASYGNGTTPLVASAPPPDDATLSSSTNSRFLGDSNGNSFQGSVSLQHYQNGSHNGNGGGLLLTMPAGLKSYSNNDAWETDTGGVTGRSHALSASYALDSPAYAPHLRGMEERTWEDSHVRPCSPA